MGILRSTVLGAGVALAMTAAAQAQLTADNTTPGQFIDISASGTDLGLNADDASVTWSSPFANCVLGAGVLNVSSNGIVVNPANSAFSNAALVAASTPGYYTYWDDMRTDNAGGDVFAQNLGDRTVIQWNNIGTFSGGTGTGTFQVQIFPGATGIQAQYIYVDTTFGGGADGGGSATIGAVSNQGQGFVQWSFNTPGSAPDGSIVTIRCIPAPSAMALVGLGGLIAARRRRA